MPLAIQYLYPVSIGKQPLTSYRHVRRQICLLLEEGNPGAREGMHAHSKHLAPPNDPINERAPTHAFLNVGSGLLLFADFQ